MSLSLLEPEVVTPPANFTRRVLVSTTTTITIKRLCADGHTISFSYSLTTKERREV
jgi:hypothetical protein